MRKVLILTDQKGWHYKQLKKSFENNSLKINDIIIKQKIYKGIVRSHRLL